MFVSSITNSNGGFSFALISIKKIATSWMYLVKQSEGTEVNHKRVK
jgi:hypothetical protein